MSDSARLAALLFPHVTTSAEQLMQAQYPPRTLSPGAVVTRFAPSPTGFMHIGGVFTATVAERTAHGAGGRLILRVEDTDKKREIENGVALILDSLSDFGVRFDEGPLAEGGESGAYGPYVQSARRDLYHAFCKLLVEKGHAYPCFCTEDELAALRQGQEARGLTPGYWGEDARCRALPLREAEARIAAGAPYVVRLRSPGKPGGRVRFRDVIRGDIEMEENYADVVLLKSDGLPTYHFAHVVDDTLMGVNQVIRGEEWIASAPIHLQLFAACGLRPIRYAHVSPIMKEEDGRRRKLSKRRDPEAAAAYFTQEGYPAQAVVEYLLSIANSNFEDWRRQNRDKPYTDFPFSLKKMSPSGALFDLIKLRHVSGEFIARLSAREVYDRALAWAERHDAPLAARLAADPDYATALFAIDRGGPKPRKDIAKWSDVAGYASYFYDQTFEPGAPLPRPAPEDQRRALAAYAEVYDPQEDKQAWFERLRALCPELGFCPDVKAYKTEPERYKGSVSDLAAIVRTAVTGRPNTPDLCAIMALLGRERCLARMADYAARL